MRLAEEFWNSEYAKLEADELVAKAGIWASDMADVPSHAVPELHRRTMRKHANTWAPTLGDFRAAWLDPAWDFWAEQNSVPEAKAPVFGVLPPVPADLDGLEAATARLQFEAMAKRGTFVCCECRNSLGNTEPAMLDALRSLWICRSGKCEFSWPVADSLNAPTLARIESPTATATTKKSHNYASSWLHDAARACELSVDAMDAKEFANFMMWAKWFKSRYDCPMSYDLMNDTWDEWSVERIKS